MPHRDPETGKFVGHDDMPDYDRFEESYNQHHLSIAAADLDGATGQTFGESEAFEGQILYDLDTVVDRDEVAVMVWAEHAVKAYFASTATADSTIRAVMAISTSGAIHEVVHEVIQANPVDEGTGDGGFTIDVDGSHEVTADLVGRPLVAVGFGPITDGATGVGGAGTEGQDWWEGQPVAAPTFDARDEMTLQGAIDISNASDLSAHVEVTSRHVYGVLEDFF